MRLHSEVTSYKMPEHENSQESISFYCFLSPWNKPPLIPAPALIQIWSLMDNVHVSQAMLETKSLHLAIIFFWIPRTYILERNSIFERLFYSMLLSQYSWIWLSGLHISNPVCCLQQWLFFFFLILKCNGVLFSVFNVSCQSLFPPARHCSFALGSEAGEKCGVFLWRGRAHTEHAGSEQTVNWFPFAEGN